MAEGNYTIKLENSTTGGGMLDATMSLVDSSNNVVAKGKYDAGSKGALILKEVAVGGMVNFKIFDPSDNLVASTKAVFGIPKHFDIYQEPEHTLMYNITFEMVTVVRKMLISDASNKPLWTLESSLNPLQVFVHKIYKYEGHEEIGSFSADIQDKSYTITCNDTTFPTTLLLGLWLIGLYDTSSRGGSMSV
jgi:hypothetical protein